MKDLPFQQIAKLEQRIEQLEQENNHLIRWGRIAYRVIQQVNRGEAADVLEVGKAVVYAPPMVKEAKD